MLLERTLDELGKKNKVALGIDLRNDITQLTYCRADQSVPETISLVNGEEQYNIPTVLCRNSEQHQWYYGKEALQKAQAGEGVLVEDLVLLASNQSVVAVGDMEFAIEELIEIFLKKCLGLVSNFVKVQDISNIAFTLRAVTPELMEVIKKAVAGMALEDVQLQFMTRKDSFFQYMLHQPEEMWIHDVLLFEYGVSGVKSYLMEKNLKTRPVVCMIEEDHFPQMKQQGLMTSIREQKEAYQLQLDAAFLEIIKEKCDEKNITSVFLVGDEFSTQWCKESIRYLCKGRRVFQGNNLFCKGACYGARESLIPSTLMQEYVHLSDEKLVANLGMQCNKGKQEIYLPLLHAGMNWYDAGKELDIMLSKNNKIAITITPVDGRAPRIAEITLEGLYVRGNRTNRIGMRIDMKDAHTVRISLKDKGFGDIFPSSGQMWQEEFSLQGI